MLPLAAGDPGLGNGFYVATGIVTVAAIGLGWAWLRPSYRVAYRRRLAREWGSRPQAWWPYGPPSWRAWRRMRRIGLGVLVLILPIMWLLALSEALDVGWLGDVGAALTLL